MKSMTAARAATELSGSSPGGTQSAFLLLSSSRSKSAGVRTCLQIHKVRRRMNLHGRFPSRMQHCSRCAKGAALFHITCACPKASDKKVDTSKRQV